MKRVLGFFVLSIAALAAAACSDSAAPAGNGGNGDNGGNGMTSILLTDAPFPYSSVGSVQVHIMSVAVSPTGDTTGLTDDWVTVAEPDSTFDLLSLQNGNTALMGETELQAGDYKAVRVDIDPAQSRITWADGSEASVYWQAAYGSRLYALVEEPLGIPSDGGRIVIDFDVGRSFLVGELPGYDFLFIPVIRAVDEAETGSIAGTVTAPSIEGDQIPLPGAGITVYRGNPQMPEGTWGVAATGRAGADGHYTVAFLSPGTYIVRAYPPAEVVLARSTATGVTVTVGAETTQDFALTRDGDGGGTGQGWVAISGNTNIAVGDSAAFIAFLYSAEGDSLDPSTVTWNSSKPSIAGLTFPQGAATTQVVWVKGNAMGTALISAQIGDLADSVSVIVGQSTDSSTAAVATVEVNPVASTVSVGDSTAAVAVLRDAGGQVLTGRTVSWSVSDSTVMQIQGSFAEYAVLRALAEGSVTLLATSEGKSGSATIVVNP